MKLPNLFKNRYGNLKGKAWIRTVSEEDRAAFAHIGMEASDYGRKGGQALVKKYGREHMAKIGKLGAAATARLHEFNRMMEDITGEESLGLQ